MGCRGDDLGSILTNDHGVGDEVVAELLVSDPGEKMERHPRFDGDLSAGTYAQDSRAPHPTGREADPHRIAAVVTLQPLVSQAGIDGLLPCVVYGTGLDSRSEGRQGPVECLDCQGLCLLGSRFRPRNSCGLEVRGSERWRPTTP